MKPLILALAALALVAGESRATFHTFRTHRFVGPFVHTTRVRAVVPVGTCALPNYLLADGLPYGTGTQFATLDAFVASVPVAYQSVVRTFFVQRFFHRGIGFHAFFNRGVYGRAGRFFVRRGVGVRGNRLFVRGRGRGGRAGVAGRGKRFGKAKARGKGAKARGRKGRGGRRR